MRTPFTVSQFMEVFRNYNQTIWPMQIIFYILGIIAVFFAIRKTKQSDKIISGILVFLWLWMGIVYHIMHFSSINRPAYVFGILFVIQGIIFLISGVFLSKISFKFEPDGFSITGSIFIIYAMIIYPILGYFLGHIYPESPCFGVAPCPSVIFTFGILLLINKKLPLHILIIPFIWSIIGFSAAIFLGVREDIGLLVAGLLGTFLLIIKNKKIQRGKVN